VAARLALLVGGGMLLGLGRLRWSPASYKAREPTLDWAALEDIVYGGMEVLRN
jgi:hypothetical protein